MTNPARTLKRAPYPTSAPAAVPPRASSVVGVVARLVLRSAICVYLVMLQGAGLLARWRHRRTRHTGLQVLLTGTFHAESWARAHLRPLAASSSCGHVCVVSTSPLRPIPKVHVVTPARWLIRLLGPVAARLITFAWLAFRRRPDIVGGFHLLFNGMAAVLLARLVGARSLYFCVGGPAEILDGGLAAENRLFRLLPGPDEFLEQRLAAIIAHFDVVITMGTRAAAYLRARRADQASAIIPGGFDVEEFRPPQDIDTKSLDVVFVGRLVPVKRVDILINSIALVRDVLPDVSLKIVGDGPLRGALEHQTRTLGLTRNVSFVGQQVAIRDHLIRARMFVLPSDSEGLALAVVEAMLCGVPVVCSNVGDLPDLVENDVNGYLVDSRQPAAFAQCIRKILDNPEQWTRLSRAARATAEQLEVSRVSPRWDTVLRGPRIDDPLPDSGIASPISGAAR